MIPITESFVTQLSNEARITARKRKNYNYHKLLSDTLQRLLNAMEPDTYVQPHKHDNPDKREAFIIIKGEVLVVEFDDHGEITEHIILNHSKGNYGVEIQEKTWHTLISLKPGSVVYELKDGPYNPENDKKFADWAPVEGSEEAKNFNLRVLEKLNIL